jgi:hypothetical protein
MSEAGAATFNDLVYIGGGSLNFTKADGVGIYAKESLIAVIDSDNNDSGRVFQVQTGAGQILMTLAENSEAIFNNGGVDLDFRVASDNNSHMLFVDAGSDRVKVGSSATSGFAILSVYDDRDNSASNWFDDKTGLELYNSSQPAGYGTSVGILLEAHSGESAYMYSEAPSNSNVTGYIGARTSGTNNRDLIFWTPSSVTINDDSYDVDFRVEGNTNTHMLFVDAGNNSVSINTSQSSNALALNVKGYAGYQDIAGYRWNVNNATSVGVNANQVYVAAGGFVAAGAKVGDEIFISGTSNAINTVTAVTDTILTCTNNWTQSFAAVSCSGYSAVDISAGYNTRLGVRVKADGSVIVNDNGNAVQDFRVESDNNTHMLFVDAGNNSVAMGTSAPASYVNTGGLAVKGATYSDLALVSSSISSGSNSHQLRFYNEAGASYEIARTRVNVGAGQVNRGEYQFSVNNGATLRPWLDVNYSGDVVFNSQSYDSDFRVSSDNNTHMLFVDEGNNTVNIGASSDVMNSTLSKLSVTTAYKTSGSAEYDATLSLVGTGGGSTGNRGATIAFTGEDGTSARTLAKIEGVKGNSTSGDHDGALVFRIRSSGSDLKSQMTMLDYVTIVNDDGLDKDFYVESLNNTNMFVIDADVDRVRVGGSSSLDAQITVQNENNAFSYGMRSSGTIGGAGTRADFLEGTFAYNTTTSGNQLSIPVFSQGSNWKPYYVELSFVTGEYNAPGGPLGGRVIFEVRSLTTLNGLSVKLTEGNVSGMTSSGMNLLVNFTTAYTAGLSDYEGVMCHAKILGTAASYIQMDIATLN